jgi:hypothetical protein
VRHARKFDPQPPGATTSVVAHVVASARTLVALLHELRAGRRGLQERPGTVWINRTLSVSYARLGERTAALESINALHRQSPDLTIGQIVAAIPSPRDFLDRVAEGLNDLGLPP